MDESTKLNSMICFFCDEKKPKYSCPKCTVQYCSLNCYKSEKHVECSEQFYKDQVMNELQDMKSNGKEGKDKIIDILKKMKKQDEKSGKGFDDVNEITNRLDGIDLDDTDAVWEKLTSEEQTMFRNYVEKGKLDFMPMWTPWWSLDTSSKIVDVTQKRKRSENVPAILKDRPKLKDIIGNNRPNDNLRFCLLDIILTYTCTQRIFNGDLYDSPYETYDIISRLSKVLSQNKVYSDLDSCILSFINDLNLISDIDVDPVDVCLEDLRQVVTSLDSCILRALSDFYKFLKKCQKFVKKENEEISKKLFKMWKKVYFYIAYCGEYESELRSMGDGIRELQRYLSKERDSLRKQKEIIEENLDKLKPNEDKKKPLVEEVKVL